MNDKDACDPAFPVAAEFYSDGSYRSYSYPGMSLRQYAAIKLKVADSGVDWLDEMITESNRDDIATKALQGLLSSKVVATPEDFAKGSYKIADAMLAAEIGRSIK